MLNTVKSFLVDYDPINKSNVFASGDFVRGRVTLELSKECSIQSLCIKLKGKADVQWTEHHGKSTVTYHGKEKFFSIKQCLLQEGQGNDCVRQGSHVYPFTFQIPAQELPSSFKGRHGKILYTLEASLSRSMRMDTKAKAQLTLVHKANLSSHPELMATQHSLIDKRMTLLNSGTVGMDVTIERKGFYQGEGVKVVASIQNRTSRDVTLKYSLYSKHSFLAKGKRKLETKEILKEVGDAIPPSGGQTVTRIIAIPPQISASIMNCDIINVEYRLKVYLDVKYATDPVLKFPIIILPALEGADMEQPAPPVYGFEAFSQPGQFGEPSFFPEPASTAPLPPPYSFQSDGLYPSLPGFDTKP